MIQRLGPQEWRRCREIRLRALLDAPDAFGSTWAAESALTDEEWQRRLADPQGAIFVACVDGVDVGIARGGTYDEHAGLYSMWVDPAARGRGIADALVVAVRDWAIAQGYRRLLLGVADTNTRAVAFYARLGFVPTGVVGTLPPPRTHIREHQRALDLKHSAK